MDVLEILQVYAASFGREGALQEMVESGTGLLVLELNQLPPTVDMMSWVSGTAAGSLQMMSVKLIEQSGKTS